MSTYDSIPSSQVAASLGSGVEVGEVIDWQVSRSLSGGGLPQQARAVSGSSVGSGSVTLVPDAPGESPWSVNATVPGEAVSIDAAADVGAPVSPVARMVSRDVSADGWLSPVRTLSIEDEVPRGQVLIPESIDQGAVDACAVIHAAARAAGYRSTPPPAAGAIVSLPLVGSLWPEVGPLFRQQPPGEPVRYATVGGSAMLTDAWVRNATEDWAGGRVAPWGASKGSPYPLLGVACTAAVLPGAATGAHAEVRLAAAGFAGDALASLRLRAASGGGVVVTLDVAGTQRLSQVIPVAHGAPVRLVVTWLGVSWVDWSGVWSVLADGALVGSATLTLSTPRETGVRWVDVIATPHGALGGLQVGESTDPLDYGTLGGETALIASANSPLDAIAEPTSGDAWDIIQQVATATLGAAWIDEEGRLVYRNRDQLRGGVPQYTIEALDHLEDLPWSISTDEVADRVEFTYRPPTVSIQADDTLTVWSSQETVRVAAGATVRLDRDIDGAASGLAPWYRVEDTSPPVTRMSRYAAWTAPPGESGSAPPASALAVSSQMLTPTRIRVTIRNTTNAPLWVYQLTARARVHVQPGADVTISRGLPEATAQRPLQVNAGSWVQDDTTAQQIADWLESQSAMPLPTIPPVRVIPDASRRLGDVVRVRIESIGDHEPVVFKALITSIDNSQSAGTYEQRIGFTILAVTFDDWMRWGQALGINTFDALQAHLSHLTDFDKLDRWLTNLGGDL